MTPLGRRRLDEREKKEREREKEEKERKKRRMIQWEMNEGETSLVILISRLKRRRK